MSHAKSAETVLHNDELAVTGGRVELVGSSEYIVVEHGRPRTIGARVENDLVVGEKTVSALHAQVTATTRGLRVRNLGRNGTHNHDGRVEDIFVTRPTELRIGAVARICVKPEPPAAVANEFSLRFGRLIGIDAEMLLLFDRLRRLVDVDIPVLVGGETGTGKDALAESLHREGTRRDKPYLAFNCAALPEGTVESVLFGHAKGAFTGADTDHRGLFEQAEGGTLFLDEIAEASLSTQAKLLRAIEDREIRPLGSNRVRKVDVRVVAATHVDLPKAVSEGRFRQDLYYRLCAVSVEIPPLRSRRRDIPLLLREFLREFGCSGAVVSKEVLAKLRARQWNGNVREFRNVIHAAIRMHPPGIGGPLRLDEVAVRESGDVRWNQTWDEAVVELRGRYIEALHAACGGNITRMAETAGTGRRWIRDQVRHHGLGDSSD